MRQIILLIVLVIFTYELKAQTIKVNVVPTDTITGSYYSIEQGKIIDYQMQIVMGSDKLHNCYGYLFYGNGFVNSKGQVSTKEPSVIAYTPCNDFNLENLVIIDTVAFIRSIKINKLAFK